MGERIQHRAESAFFGWVGYFMVYHWRIAMFGIEVTITYRLTPDTLTDH